MTVPSAQICRSPNEQFSSMIMSSVGFTHAFLKQVVKIPILVTVDLDETKVVFFLLCFLNINE